MQYKDIQRLDVRATFLTLLIIFLSFKIYFCLVFQHYLLTENKITFKNPPLCFMVYFTSIYTTCVHQFKYTHTHTHTHTHTLWTKQSYFMFRDLSHENYRRRQLNFRST